MRGRNGENEGRCEGTEGTFVCDMTGRNEDTVEGLCAAETGATT